MALQEGLRILAFGLSRGRTVDSDELTPPESRRGRFSAAGMESLVLDLSAVGVCRPGYMGYAAAVAVAWRPGEGPAHEDGGCSWIE